MVRTGRPKSENPRDRAVNVRLTQEEHEALKGAAERLGLTVSEYMRGAAVRRATGRE